jgi:hypothetical protein
MKMTRPQLRWLVLTTVWAAVLVVNDYRIVELAGWLTLFAVVLIVGFDYTGARQGE